MDRHTETGNKMRKPGPQTTPSSLTSSPFLYPSFTLKARLLGISLEWPWKGRQEMALAL